MIKVKIAMQMSLPVLVFGMLSCSKKSNNYQEPSPKEYPPPVATNTFNPQYTRSDSSTAKVAQRIILIEDYTGHTCGNSPRSAETAQTISNANSGRVVVVAVHAGTQFAPPQLPNYPDDLRTQTGTDWDNMLQMSSSGLPKGAVNRAQSPLYQPYTNWNSSASSILSTPQSVKLELTTYADTVSMRLKVTVKTTFLQALSNDVKLCVVITEDSIIASQKDYNPPAGALVLNADWRPDYHFDHVLRGSLDSSMGKLLKQAPISAGAVVYKTYENYALSPWPTTPGNPKKNLANTNVVAFVYDKTTLQVLQADQIRIK